MATVNNISARAATPWFRAFAANQTTTTAQTNDIVELLSDLTDGVIIPTIAPNGAKFQGIEIMPFGGDDDNDEFRIILQHITNIQLWSTFQSASGITDTQFLVKEITSIDCTINTNAGQAGTTGGIVGAGDSCCDVITQTRTTFGTALESAFGQTSVIDQVAGTATFGSYYLPDFGPADFLRLYVDLDGGSGTAANEGNCLVKLYR